MITDSRNMWRYVFFSLPLVLGIPFNVQTTDYTYTIEDHVLTGISKNNHKSLDHLDLSGLGIRDITDNAFKNVSDVKNLDLSNNSISGLPSGIFSNFSRLKSLSLADNDLEKLAGGEFTGLKNLKFLNISKNRIKGFGCANFFGLDESVEIGTTGNPIEGISTCVFIKPQDKSKSELWDPVDNHYSKPVVSKSYTAIRIDPMDLKIKVCIREGIVEKLEVLEESEILEADCKEVEVDHNQGMVHLDRLGISKFSTGWYKLQKYRVYGLTINYNNIVNLTREILNDLPPTLHTVKLIGNKIERLPKGTILNDDITFLDLTNNSIREIDNDAFKNTRIFKLILNGNRLENTKFVTGLSSSLWTLEINNNKIERLFPQTFSKVTNLRELSLIGNKIKTIEKESLRGPRRLNSLLLEGNNIETIESGAFEELRYLKIVNLKNNVLSKLEIGLFDTVDAIVLLELSHNNFTKMTSETLGALKKNLYWDVVFSFNGIKVLEYGAFANTSIISLSLDHNKIEKIEPGCFDSTVLGRLNLDDNFLGRLSNDDTFAHLPHLNYLSLKRNNITTIERGAAKNFQSLSGLDLSGNPIKKLENGAFHGLSTLSRTEHTVLPYPVVFVNGTPLEIIQGGLFSDVRNVDEKHDTDFFKAFIEKA